MNTNDANTTETSTKYYKTQIQIQTLNTNDANTTETSTKYYKTQIQIKMIPTPQRHQQNITKNASSEYIWRKTPQPHFTKYLTTYRFFTAHMI